MKNFKVNSLIVVLLIVMHSHSVVNELLGPYKCPSDSKCQDVSLCTTDNAKKTSTGQLFYCGPEHRINYMVCCLESQPKWDHIIQFLKLAKPGANSVDSMIANESNYSETDLENSSTESTINDLEHEVIDDPVNTESTPVDKDDELEDVDLTDADIKSESDNVDNVLPSPPSSKSNPNLKLNVLSKTQLPIPPPDPVNYEKDLPDANRDSRKSLKECVCEQGPPGPPGPPGEPGKVIYVPVHVTWSAPLASLPPDSVISSTLPYQVYQQNQYQPPYQTKVSQPPYDPHAQRNPYPTSYSNSNPTNPNLNIGRQQNTQIPTLNLKTGHSPQSNQVVYPSKVYSSQTGGQTAQSQDKPTNTPYIVRHSH